LKRAFPWLRRGPPPVKGGAVELRGEKVVLREKSLEDAPDDYAWRTDEELSRLDATGPIRMSYKDFLNHSREEIIFASATSKRLAIDTLDGKHIGNCMCYDIDVRKSQAELGIMIGDREHWSKGYGTDSVNTLLDHIFTETPLERIYLHTLTWNDRARRSFAKSGFREVKTVRRSGMDFVFMEVHREEWLRWRESLADSTEANRNGAHPSRRG
jgi:RimJ/RimL family protein N-acetyltransferase